MMRTIRLIILVSLFITGCQSYDSRSAPQRAERTQETYQGAQPANKKLATYQYNNLAPFHQELIRLHNELRQDPAGYAKQYLTPLLARFEGVYLYDEELAEGIDKIKTKEGAPAVREAIAYLRQQPPLPPLRYAPILSLSANDFAEDQKMGRTGHIGSDGSTLMHRIKRRAHSMRHVGENITYGPQSARRILNALLIDDGFPSRGHREALFNPVYRSIGVASQPHSQYRLVTVIHYADQIQPR